MLYEVITDIKIDQTATTVTTATFTIDVPAAAATVAGANFVVTTTDVLKSGVTGVALFTSSAPAAYTVSASVTAKGTNAWAVAQTKDVAGTYAAGTLTIPTANMTAAGFGATDILSKVVLKVSTVKPATFDATKVDYKTATIDGAAAVVAATFADDTTIVINT